MLFDVFFFGFPIAIAICLVAHAVRDADVKFWRAGISMSAYCAFYLLGGREVILYLLCGLMMMGGWCGMGLGGGA